jgi:hypothetical protein
MSLVFSLLDFNLFGGNIVNQKNSDSGEHNVFLDFFTLEDGKNRLSRNVYMELLFDAA